jgi:hypothetical protein
MCPLCLSGLAWLATGSASAAALGAVIVKLRRKGDEDGHSPHRDS